MNLDSLEQQRLEIIRNMPEPDPQDFIDFTPMQMTKIFIGCVFGIFVVFLLWKVHDLQLVQIAQNNQIIKLLQK